MTQATYLLLLGAAAAFHRCARAYLPRFLARLGYGLVAIVIASFIWTRSEPPNLFSDFVDVYYWAGRAALDEPEAIYDSEVAEPAVAGFKNIPIAAFLFAPFALLDVEVAQWIFTAAGVAAAATAMGLLVRAVAPENRFRSRLSF
jgi:hypothetical protein